jgi:hypothetical protein
MKWEGDKNKGKSVNEISACLKKSFMLGKKIYSGENY